MFFQNGAAVFQHGSVHTYICLPWITVARDSWLGAVFITWQTKKSSVAFLSYNNALLEKKKQGKFSLKRISRFPFLLDNKHRVHLLWMKYLLPELHSVRSGAVSQLAWRDGGVVQMFLHICVMHGTTAHQYATVILHLFILFVKHCPLKKSGLSLPPKMVSDFQVY